MRRNRPANNADGVGGYGGYAPSGGPPGWQGDPAMAHPPPPPQHQQQYQQYSHPHSHSHLHSQQPQFRGQWNDYAQTQPTQPYGSSQYSQYGSSQYGGSQYGNSQAHVADADSMPPPQPRKRQRAAKRRVRQPLSGPAGIWFRMSKKAASASSTAMDSKAGILKTSQQDSSADNDDAFGFEEAADIAHQAHQAMADRDRRERQRREEEEMLKGGGGDDDNNNGDDDVDVMYDEETGQTAKVPGGTASTFEPSLGRAWDAMCLSMDRIVPEPSVYLHRHRRQPYDEIRAALDGSPCGKLRHFSLLSEIMGRDGPNRDAGVPGSGGTLRVGHLVVSIASVHNNNHCDWTVELRDETVAAASSSSSADGRDGTGGGGDDDRDGGAPKGTNSVVGWVEEQLLKDHPEWIRPGVVLYLRDAACTVFEAITAGGLDDTGGPGGPGAPNSSLLSSGNGLDRMLLICESCVVCVWSPESHMDREDFLTLIEKRSTARDKIKEEVTDLTQDNAVDEKPSDGDAIVKSSPASSAVTNMYAQTKPSHVEVYETEVKTSLTQEGEKAAIDLTADDIDNNNNQEEVGATQDHDMANGTAQIALTNPYARDFSQANIASGSARSSPAKHGAPMQKETTSNKECSLNALREPIKSNDCATADESKIRNGDDVAINNPYQKLSSEVTPNAPMPKTCDKNSEPLSKQNSEAKASAQPAAASSIWATTEGNNGDEETSEDHNMFSSGLSSTQDESLSPMVPSKDNRSSAASEKDGALTSETEHSFPARKESKEKRAVASGIFSGACENMFDDLEEEDDDDF